MKYHPITKVPAIRNLTRIIKPGLRKYSGVEAMPRVFNGLGIAILSTSKGVMTDKEAKTEKVGGEVLMLCLLIYKERNRNVTNWKITDNDSGQGRGQSQQEYRTC